ncbi:hypothetical protein FA951_13400 [Dermacoccus nishinomiyaensis]|uniref:NTP transferase domain-containing protein n=1 Tax=Dermacoccus nishinomiyaensis TaxID=1274 RepID=UPI0010ABFF9A|nr:NTP transferase domain-containing protein [Dermacoccus nishinomiyaensis]TJZ94877.1 hypothetical protein FA951_13400 [Dermacoccus nishinomiyaensis]
MKHETVTVVIACAGKGSRFDAPYPKELHAISPGVTVLHRALQPIDALKHNASDIRLLMVTDPSRRASMEIACSEAGHSDLAFVVQTLNHGSGLAGVLRAARPWARGVTVLLLADQFFESPSDALARLVDLVIEHRGAVLAAPDADVHDMSQEGALRIDEETSMVIRSAEKPSNLDGFNAVWVALAAREDSWDFLERAVSETPDSLADAPSVTVDGYRNVTYPT